MDRNLEEIILLHCSSSFGIFGILDEIDAIFIDKHSSIIQLATKTFNTCDPTQKHVSIFNRLPFVLISECISYLNQRDRAKVCRINLLFLKSGSQSIAKCTVLLHHKFIAND